MELTLVLRILLRRWWLIALPTVIGAAFALPDLADVTAVGSAGFNTRIRYSAAQELVIPERDGDYQDVWLASELTVNAFTDWVRSSSFREEIAISMDDSVDMSALGIAADNARSIGVIYLSYRDANALEDIAAATIAVLSKRNEQYFPQLGGETAQVTILEAPIIVPSPAALTNRIAPLIRIAVALFIGIALAIIAEYIDQRIHHGDDVRRLGLQVIGTIPRYRV